MMAIMVGGTVMRDASGDINDLWETYNGSFPGLSILDTNNDTAIENNTFVNRTWIYGTSFDCTSGCKYGSHHSFEVRLLHTC